ncbi:uncharacterized protein AB9X84_010493 isoform 1-T1 [Acanthopagrus schlegelii]
MEARRTNFKVVSSELVLQKNIRQEQRKGRQAQGRFAWPPENCQTRGEECRPGVPQRKAKNEDTTDTLSQHTCTHIWNTSLLKIPGTRKGYRTLDIWAGGRRETLWTKVEPYKVFSETLQHLAPGKELETEFPQLLRVTHTSASEEEDSEPELLGGDATEPPHPHQAPHSVHLKDQVILYGWRNCQRRWSKHCSGYQLMKQRQRRQNQQKKLLTLKLVQVLVLLQAQVRAASAVCTTEFWSSMMNLQDVPRLRLSKCKCI